MYDLDQEAKASGDAMDLEKTGILDRNKVLPLVLLVITFVVIIYGAIA